MRKNNICAILNLDEDTTRLGPLATRRPVAALPFGCRYRLIDFPFSSLYSAGIPSAALFIAGSGRALYDHIRGGHAWGLDSSVGGGGVFTYSQLALKEEQGNSKEEVSYYQDQIDYVKRSKADCVIVMGSKMLCNVDIEAVLRYHKEKKADITVVYKNVERSLLSENAIDKYLTFDGEEDPIITHIESVENAPADVQRIPLSMKMWVMETSRYIDYVNRAREEGVRDDMTTLIRYALENEKVLGYEYTGFLRNIDSVQSYFEANMAILDEDNYNALFYRNHQVITKSKNGAPTFYSENSNTKNAQVASDCLIEGSVEDSLIFRKVKVKKDAQIKSSIIMQGSVIGEGAQLEYVILDKGVKVGPGVELKGTKDKVLVIEKGSEILEEKGA